MFYQNFVKYQPILVALADTNTENSQNQTNNVILVIGMSAEHISQQVLLIAVGSLIINTVIMTDG